jgi:DNA-binding XRE family transcriptional regulator
LIGLFGFWRRIFFQVLEQTDYNQQNKGRFMPTGKQIRAARMLVEWDAGALAERIGMSRISIQNIERGEVRPKIATMLKIVQAFADAGVEFIGDTGVILKEDELTKLTGQNPFVQVLDNVMTSMRGQDGAEVLFACVIDKLSPPPVIEAYRHLRKSGIRMRSLVKENDTYLMGTLEEYRALPEGFFHNNPMIIYGDKVAFMVLDVQTRAAQSLPAGSR